MNIDYILTVGNTLNGEDVALASWTFRCHCELGFETAQKKLKADISHDENHVCCRNGLSNRHGYN